VAERLVLASVSVVSFCAAVGSVRFGSVRSGREAWRLIGWPLAFCSLGSAALLSAGQPDEPAQIGPPGFGARAAEIGGLRGEWHWRREWRPSGHRRAGFVLVGRLGRPTSASSMILPAPEQELERPGGQAARQPE